MATGTLFPAPWFLALDSNGNPLSGAKGYFYTAGTSTPTTTYSDVALTIANANPVIADSAGRMGPIFLSPGASYKFTLKDSTDALVRSQDNISGPGGASNADILGTAGEALTAGQAVYLSDGSGGKTAGLWYKADAAQTYSSTLPETGMAPASIASSSAGTIRLQGAMTGLSSLTVGTTYYVGTAGALTSTAPTNARKLGVADTTSSLILKDIPAVALGVVTLTDGATVALDAALGSTFRLVAAGNRTILAPTNPTSGQKIVIVHVASGADRTLALTTGAAGFRFGTDIPALTATTSAKSDYIGCIYNAVDNRWDVVAVTKNF